MRRMRCRILAETKRAAAADMQCGVPTKTVPDAASEAKRRAAGKRDKASWCGDGSGNALPGVRKADGAAGTGAETKDVQ